MGMLGVEHMANLRFCVTQKFVNLRLKWLPAYGSFPKEGDPNIERLGNPQML